jgi:glycosyltransferase involved in cell wall biosynthesis
MKIAIFMSTYNGEKYINQQLESIFNQKVCASIELYIRDDGSTDRTIDIIRKWKEQFNITLFIENNVGPAQSFWKLFSMKDIKADFYAFADQDDLWDSNKLQVGIDSLKNDEKEALWCSNCRIIDQNGIVFKSEMNKNTPDFNIISQFICGTTQGCAMLLNDQLRNYILSKSINKIPMHDFVIMTYAIAKGKVIYEKCPTFGYRVHNNNVVAKEGKNPLKHAIDSLNRWFSKEHKNELSLYAEEFLINNEEYLDNLTREYLNELIDGRDSIVSRMKIVFNTNTKSQNKKAERSFKIRMLLGIL